MFSSPDLDMMFSWWLLPCVVSRVYCTSSLLHFIVIMCVALLDVIAFLLDAPEIMQIDQGLYWVAITAFVTVIHVASSP